MPLCGLMILKLLVFTEWSSVRENCHGSGARLHILISKDFGAVDVAVAARGVLVANLGCSLNANVARMQLYRCSSLYAHYTGKVSERLALI